MKKLTLIIAVMLLLTPAWQTASAEETSVDVEANAEVRVENENQRPGIFLKIRGFLENKVDIRGERKENMEEKRQERKENRQDSREMVRENWKKNLAKMVLRMEATVERHNRILDRIISRIEKIKALGGDTSTSESFVAQAKTHLGEATSAIASLKIVIDAELTATTTASTTTPVINRDSIARIRAVTEKVKTSLKAAHAAMVRAVVNLKGMSSVNSQATTTATTTTSN